ncbi:MAG TPA: trypsin-like peptidase domain-containing protein [Candidatus Acidoferrales bacterium]|nr:trypsin-like peptidase domain-containing protein [Candidatus Acidoferrales bacterium]
MMKTRLPKMLLLIGLASANAAAQSALPRKDIPTIAKSAKESVVTIVMESNDEPIALGSGFLVSSDGAIATNYHVIASGNAAVVKFADGTVLPVDGVLAIDKTHDLAVIKVHGKIFQTLTLGNSDQVEVGEDVVAIGNPLGLELTVSNGILSGIRKTEEEGKFLQTTAPISHGSSGGPLFNMFCEVVGVNTLYLEGGASLNFAIPVNDVKNLLHKHSTQIQQLPNEASTDEPEPTPAKPDASAAIPSDAASSRENSLGVGTALHKTPSYHIRAYQHGAYVIDYEGRELEATCRETLSWLDGPDKLGGPMTEHECVYINHEVGKDIPAEQMWRGDKELRFEPLGQLKADVADVLDIIAEAPMGSPLRRPSPKTSPEILKTLQWIKNTLADEEGTTFHSIQDQMTEERVNLLPDVNGCQVTFVYATRVNWKETYHTRRQVNLGDLDPASLQMHEAAPDVIGPVSLITVYTTDKVPTIRLMVNDRSWQPAAATVPSTDLLWELPAPYAARFTKALRQAITLCGGKSSSF